LCAANPDRRRPGRVGRPRRLTADEIALTNPDAPVRLKDSIVYALQNCYFFNNDAETGKRCREKISCMHIKMDWTLQECGR
jgi:hypothetical protein